MSTGKELIVFGVSVCVGAAAGTFKPEETRKLLEAAQSLEVDKEVNSRLQFKLPAKGGW